MIKDDDDAATAALLSRLGNQFGDLDVANMVLDNNEKKDDYDSDESSLLEPSAEELLAWQQAQFNKGEEKVRSQKIASVDLTPMEKRRLLRQQQQQQQQNNNSTTTTDADDDEDEWEDIPPQPKLEEKSYFFPDESSCHENNDSDDVMIHVGTHPMLLKLADVADASAAEVMGGTWKRLYSSYFGDGLSFFCLLEAIRGYGGPTVLLMEVVPSAKHSLQTTTTTTTTTTSSSTKKKKTIGFYTTSTWIESTNHYGTEDCFLFSFDKEEAKDEETIRLFKPKKRGNNSDKSGIYMYCHPSTFNSTSRGNTGSTNGAVHGLGMGGTSRQPRVHITQSLEECRVLSYDAAFESGQLLDGEAFDNSLNYFDIQQMEVWGIGGRAWIKDALTVRETERQRTVSNLQKARTIQNKEQFMGDLRLMDNTFFQHDNNDDDGAI